MGNYSVVVSNAYGSVTSSNALVTLWPLVGWGRNDNTQADIPAGLTSVTAIAAGLDHNLVLRTDGTVAAWGAGKTNSGVIPNYGQALVPAGLTNVAAIAAGYYHSLALRADGTLAAWGAGTNNTGVSPQYGQCMVPVGLSNVTAVAAGGYHSLALQPDGTVAVWGDNSHGQTNLPTGLATVAALAAGRYHSLAFKADGTVVAWGAGTNNTGSLPDHGQSVVPGDLSNVVAIAAGSYHSLALKGDGSVVVWGYNSAGQTNVPGGLSNVVEVAGGYAYSLALKSDGTVVAWGDSTYGQTNVPAALANVAKLSAGGFHDLVLENDGRPALTVQPVGQTVIAGTAVRFQAMAVGVQPLNYQWRFQGSDIGGATLSSYTLAGAQSAAARDHPPALQPDGGCRDEAQLQRDRDRHGPFGLPMGLRWHEPGRGHRRHAALDQRAAHPGWQLCRRDNERGGFHHQLGGQPDRPAVRDAYQSQRGPADCLNHLPQ